jgi:hypothetical protein
MEVGDGQYRQNQQEKSYSGNPPFPEYEWREHTAKIERQPYPLSVAVLFYSVAYSFFPAAFINFTTLMVSC